MVPSALACTSLTGESIRLTSKMATMRLPQDATFHSGTRNSLHMVQNKGRTFCTMSNNEASPIEGNEATPQQQPSLRTYDDLDSDRYQMSPTVRRRPYNLEAKMRMKAYRREAMVQRRQKELEEETKNFQLDYSSIYQKGAPGTVQGVIREIISLGYFVTLPNGREGLLAASHLGCSGGIPLLERLFKVGQEITVRVIPVPNPAGRDRLYVRP
eukprot:c43242_g1_i1 orf=243-881(+)